MIVLVLKRYTDKRYILFAQNLHYSTRLSFFALYCKKIIIINLDFFERVIAIC